MTPLGEDETSKAEADRLVIEVGQSAPNHSVAVLRPTIVFGAGMPNRSIAQMVAVIERGLFFFIGRRGASANYVHVSNVVDALRAVRESPCAAGRIYNLSDWTTIEEFARAIADALGRPRPAAARPRTSRSRDGRCVRPDGRAAADPARIDALVSRARYAVRSNPAGARLRAPRVRLPPAWRSWWPTRRADEAEGLHRRRQRDDRRAFLGPAAAGDAGPLRRDLVVNSPASDLLREMGVTGAVMPMPIGRAISVVADVRALCAGAIDAPAAFRPRALDDPEGGASRDGRGTPLECPGASSIRLPARSGRLARAFPERFSSSPTDMIARCATSTLADSHSQREFLIRERIVAPDRIAVLGSGSVSGVDATRFRPDAARRRHVREQFHIPDASVVLLFVGRLSRDKGVLDFAKAFATLAAELPDVHALVVGPDEEGLRPAVAGLCGKHGERLHFLEYTNMPGRDHGRRRRPLPSELPRGVRQRGHRGCRRRSAGRGVAHLRTGRRSRRRADGSAARARRHRGPDRLPASSSRQPWTAVRTRLGG